jgi:hypothetical protein
MKKLITTYILLAALPLFADEPTPVGDWVTYKENDQTVKEGLVHIFQSKSDDGTMVLDGKIGNSLGKPDPNAPTICVNCPAPFTGKKIQGLQFLWGFVQDDDNTNHFVDGHVLDPLTGNVYSAEMTLSDDAQTLVFRGYMGISLFGSDRTWTRATKADR